MRDAQSASEDRTANARPAAAWGTSSGFLDLDFLRLGFGRLRNRDLQDSVRHGRLYARRIDTRRQLKDAVEHAVAPLAELNVLVFLVFLDLLFAADGEGIILDRYLDVLALEPGHLCADLDGLVGLGYFNAGDDGLCAVWTHPLRKFAEQPIDLSMQAE